MVLFHQEKFSAKKWQDFLGGEGDHKGRPYFLVLAPPGYVIAVLWCLARGSIGFAFRIEYGAYNFSDKNRKGRFRES